MLVYAGIDEAGYGPLLGPLVIVRSVFVLDGHEPTLEPPSMWKLLSGTVCKKPADKKGRLAINDSKTLFAPGRSLKDLERGLLSFLLTSGMALENLDGLLETLAYDLPSCRINNDMYRDPDRGPQVPLVHSLSELNTLSGKLHRVMLTKSLRLDEIRAAVVFEDRFNQLVKNFSSKAEFAWAFFSGHLRAIWLSYGEHHPLVAVDRQGGRKTYRQLLESVFPTAEVNTLFENPAKSCYKVTEGRRQIHVLVEVNSEKRHLPAALASMAAKYLRELLMRRFQAFWLARAPDVKPTAGYFQDGRRFLREIGPLITEYNIDPGTFIRCC